MTRSSRVASLTGLAVALLATVLPAEEPAKKTERNKPQWQRYLRGEDEKKAAELEKQLNQFQQDEQFAEALKVAEALTALRQKSQGADHWQTINARSEAEQLRRVARTAKKEQQSYSRIYIIHREAKAIEARGHFREAQPLLEEILAICRNILGEE